MLEHEDELAGEGFEGLLEPDDVRVGQGLEHLHLRVDLHRLLSAQLAQPHLLVHPLLLREDVAHEVDLAGGAAAQLPHFLIMRDQLPSEDHRSL